MFLLQHRPHPTPPDKNSEAYLQKVKDKFTTLKEETQECHLYHWGATSTFQILTGITQSLQQIYPHRISQTYLDITQDLGFEQMMNFPTRQENILDLVFTSHPEYKIRCMPLPPIGEKSDHDIVLYDTSHQVFRARPPRRKMFLWKKANLDGIRKSISSASSNFMDTEFDGIEAMWAALKTAVTTSLEEHVPTKMSSTRCTSLGLY